MKYQFIDQQRRYHCVEKMASVLGVSRSGYYAWRNREPSEHGKRDGILVSEIRRIQEGVAKHRYGSPRMTKELQRRSFVVGHNRVAKLMRANGLNARQRNKFRTTTMSGHKHEAAPNIVDRSFTPQRPNQVWASDAMNRPGFPGDQNL